MPFFYLFDNIKDEHHFPPSRIFNVDEKGVTTVQGEFSGRSLWQKKQVGSLMSGEQGTLTTAEVCMNAAGYHLPPNAYFSSCQNESFAWRRSHT